MMMCKHVECHHFKVCMEWYSLGNENCINDSYGGCEHYSTADFQIPSQMRLSELRTLLNNYDDKDMVQLRIYGSSDYPSADLVINDNTIMSDEY